MRKEGPIKVEFDQKSMFPTMSGSQESAIVIDQIAKQNVSPAKVRFVKLLLFLKNTTIPSNTLSTATRLKIIVIYIFGLNAKVANCNAFEILPTITSASMLPFDKCNRSSNSAFIS